MVMPLMQEYQQLKDQLRSQRDLFNQDHNTRLHRALSWLKAAEEQLEADNQDQAFINLWISFSACFYVEGQTPVHGFLQQLVEMDKDKAIYDCLWHEYSGSVKALIKNPYVFDPFWQYQRALGEQKQADEDTENEWRAQFDQSSIEALNCLSREKIPELLAIVLDRLYVLRNQVLQGGATYQSSVNREQVEDGVKLLACLLPIIIRIMLNANADNSACDWGELAYPVIVS